MALEYLTPLRIAGITGGEYAGDGRLRDIHVAGAVSDNRDVSPGNLFVCIRGERVDGHTFANSAFQAGAACCLAEHPIPDAQGPYVLVDSTLSALKTLGAHYRRQFKLPVIGVTGSVGKTSVKEMTACVLGAKYTVLKTKKNHNNEIGVPLTLLSLDEAHEAAVIEMGISDFGEMSRLAEMVRPDICIMTNIGYSHLKELGDLDGVLRAKSEVFAYMKPNGIAIMNGDDALLRGYDPGIRKIMFGSGPDNDIRAENIRAEGTDAVLCDIAGSRPGENSTERAGSRPGENSRFSVRIPAYGSHLALAASAAAAVGRLLDMAYEEIRRGILAYVPVEGRANVKNTGFVTLIDDSYNANPNSVKAALDSLSGLPGRHVAILGDMLNLGPQSSGLHREIGEIAARSGVRCLICRGDSAKFIAGGYASRGSAAAEAGGSAAVNKCAEDTANSRAVHLFDSNAELIGALAGLLNKGDYVLVKASNGMHFSEIADHIAGMAE